MNREIHKPEWNFIFKDGSHLSITDFITKHSTYLKAQVFKYVKDKDQVKDILQEIIIKIYTHKDQFESENKLVAYLHRSCINAAIDHLKYKSKESEKIQQYISVQTPDTNTPPIDENETYLKSLLLGKIFNKWKKLSPKNREILKQTYVKGATNKEIAEKLKTTEAYIKTQKYKLIQKFKKDPLD